MSLKKVNIANNVYQYSVLLLAFTLPLKSNLNSLFTILAFLSFLVLLYYNRQSLKINRKDLIWNVFMNLLFIIPLLGIVYSENTTAGWKQIERSITLLIIPWMMSLFPISSYKKLFNWFLASLIIIICISWGNILYSIHLNNEPLSSFFKWGYSYHGLLSLFEIEGVYMGMYLLLGIIILFYRIFSLNRIDTRTIIFSFVILAFSFFIINTNTRMSILLLILVLTGAFIYKIYKTKSLIWIVIMGLSTVAFVYSINMMPYLGSRIQISTGINTNGYENRLTRWHSIFSNLSKSELLIGVGTGDDDDFIIESYKRKNQKIALENHYNAHNQYLQYLVSGGLLLVSAFLLNIFYSMYVGLENRNNLLLLFSIIIMFVSITESIFKRQLGIVFFSFFSSALYYLKDHKIDES